MNQFPIYKISDDNKHKYFDRLKKADPLGVGIDTDYVLYTDEETTFGYLLDEEDNTVYSLVMVSNNAKSFMKCFYYFKNLILSNYNVEIFLYEKRFEKILLRNGFEKLDNHYYYTLEEYDGSK